MVAAAVSLANEMVGGADRLREDALAHAMMRMQFGKPIASFQSMKHKQADMLLELELAKSAACYAAPHWMRAMTLLWPFAKDLFRVGALHADDLAITFAAGVVVVVVLDALKPIWRKHFPSDRG